MRLNMWAPAAFRITLFGVFVVALASCTSATVGPVVEGQDIDALDPVPTSTAVVVPERPIPTPVARSIPTPPPTLEPVPTLAPDEHPATPTLVLPTVTPTRVAHSTLESTPFTTSTSTAFTPTPAPIPTPTPLVIRLPFEISDVYDPGTKSQGEISFAGDWVVIPFGGQLGGTAAEQWMPGENPDIVFELVPETVLTASVSGRIVAERNPVTTTPEGNVYDPQDWEVHIQIDNSNIFLGYDHVVELQVVDGQRVEVGDPIGRASPAAIRHGGPSGLNQVDEVEWGLRRPFSTGAEGICPLLYMPESDIAKLQLALGTMAAQGFVTGESACLRDVVDG